MDSSQGWLILSALAFKIKSDKGHIVPGVPHRFWLFDVSYTAIGITHVLSLPFQNVEIITLMTLTIKLSRATVYRW